MMNEETLREYEAAVERDGALSADAVRVLIAAVRAVRRGVDDALLHYRIGSEGRSNLVYVDWRYVATRMAGALEEPEAAG